MAHDITINADGEAEFVSGNNIVAWHKLGQVVSGLMTAEECIKQAHLDWEVEQVPVLMKGKQNDDGEDTYLEIPGKYTVRRQDNLLPLAIMSDKYTAIQNFEAFSFFDKVIGEGQASWETAGSLGGGKKVFMQATLPGKLFLRSNPEDVTEKRVLFITSHDGSTALTGLITPIRVVCQNTLNAALAKHTNMFKIFHRKNYMSRANEAAKVLEISSAYFDDLQTVMDVLAEKKASESYVSDFVSHLIPATKDTAPTRTMNRRTAIQNLFVNGMGNKGETRWDLFNAVTEFVDHHQNGRVTESRMSNNDQTSDMVKDEQRFERSLFGTGATLKQNALDLLMLN